MGKNSQRTLYYQLLDWLRVERKLDLSSSRKFIKKKRFKKHNV